MSARARRPPPAARGQQNPLRQAATGVEEGRFRRCPLPRWRQRSLRSAGRKRGGALGTGGSDVTSGAVPRVDAGEPCAAPGAGPEASVGVRSPPGGRGEKTGAGLWLAALELRASAQGGALPARLHLQGGRSRVLEPELPLNRALVRSGAGDIPWRSEAIPLGGGQRMTLSGAGHSWRGVGLPLTGRGLQEWSCCRGRGLPGGGAFWETAGPILGIGASGGGAGPTGE